MNFTCKVLIDVTDEDRNWLKQNDEYCWVETGFMFLGMPALIIHPEEKFLTFIILKFGNRLREFPIETVYSLNKYHYNLKDKI